MRRTVRYLTTALCCMLVLAAAAAFLLPRVLGWHQQVVLTGSMEPTYPVGSVTLVAPLDARRAAGLQIGDAIMFTSPLDAAQFVTHRITGVGPAGFTTRGDANDVDDPWVVQPEAVVGEVRGHIPQLGFVMRWLADRGSMKLLVGGSRGPADPQRARLDRGRPRRRRVSGSAVRPADLDVRVARSS